MKKFNSLILLIAMTLAFALQSCDDDDGYSLDNFVIEMATVAKEQGTISPYFVLDNGKTMWVSAPMVPFDNLVPGQRIIGNFTILADNKDGFDYFVRLNSYSLVLTKNIADLTVANQDSIGNDKAYLTDIWVGGNYLNVRYMKTAPGYLSLVVNRITPPDENGYANLELCYNSKSEESTAMRSAIVSFNLGEYGPKKNTAGYKGVKIKINSIKNGERILTYGYPVRDSNNHDLNTDETSSEDNSKEMY